MDADGGLPPDEWSNAGAADAGAPDAGPPSTPDAGAPGPVLYPVGLRHSPLTASVAANLRAIAARDATRRDDVFSKVGDSNTVNPNFLSCFAGANVDLDTHGELQPALAHFRAGDAGTTTPFNRVSLSAVVGWSASAALAGSPSPLEQELAAVSPRFATVMFGTNDLQAMDVFAYGRNLFGVVDRLADAGVVPLVTSIPPRDDSATADAMLPWYTLVERGVAQARQVPFLDLEPSLRALPGHGLGPDGLHLEVYTVGGAARGCVLPPAGLQHGHNVRNLLTLEGLARAWDATRGQPPPDDAAPTLAGQGSATAPFEIPSLPFVDLRDTRRDGAALIDAYPGCQSTTDESGREVLYRLTLTQPTRLRAFVVSLGNADVDVHLLTAPTGAACVARNDKLLTQSLAPGTYWLSLDTYVTGGAPQAGEYLLAVMADP